MENLTQASHKIAEQMYKTAAEASGQQAAGGGEQPSEPSGETGGDDVIDADFEVKE